MSHVIAFCPPRSGGPGKTALFFSLVFAFAAKKDSAVAVMKEKPLFPSLAGPIQTVDAEEIESTESDRTAAVIRIMKTARIREKKNVLALVSPSSGGVRLSLLAQALGPVIFEAAEGMLESDLFILGVTPSVEDIHHARRLMSRLASLGIPKERILTVGLDQGAAGGLSFHAMEKELATGLTRWICDPSLLLLAENSGKLVQELKPRGPLSRALEETAVKALNFLEKSPSLKGAGSVSIDRAAPLEELILSGVWHRLQEADGQEETSERWLLRQIDQEIGLALEKGGLRWDPERTDSLRRRIRDHVMGYGPLESLMKDPSINEIMVNGRDVFVERDGRISRTEQKFESEKQLRIVIDRMVNRVGRRVDLSSPMCDVRLEDGSRVNVILPPLSLVGPAVTIRKFRTQYQTIEDLLRSGTLDREIAALLRRSVEERQNILIAGNTGAGKTTLLNVLSGFIPAGERIMTLEDTAELQLNQKHVVRLETRPKNAEGAGEIGMADLLVNALRMRPDRLIIGECRGAEVLPMLQALNTGHDGSMATLHSNSAEDAVRRLESMVLLAAPQWPVDVIRQQIAAGIDLIVYLKRSGSDRKLTELARLLFEKGELRLDHLRRPAPLADLPRPAVEASPVARV